MYIHLEYTTIQQYINNTAYKNSYARVYDLYVSLERLSSAIKYTERTNVIGRYETMAAGNTHQENN